LWRGKRGRTGRGGCRRRHTTMALRRSRPAQARSFNTSLGFVVFHRSGQCQARLRFRLCPSIR
jgi:hypothetical protein